MIDGIDIRFHTPDPETHLLGLPRWEVWNYEDTGERIDDNRITKLRDLHLRLKPSTFGGYKLFANGSLHKFHNCGEHNADQFTFLKLVQSIDSFTDLLCIDARKCFINGLEIGVNIPLSCSPIKVFKNLVCYRSKAFTQINKKNAHKGLQCSLTQYAVKVYDKAKQSGIDCGNVLRLEIAVSKMQAIAKFNISTLADLQNPVKVYALIDLLKETLRGIIWTDSSANLKLLTPREQKQWLYYSNPKTWETFGKYQRKRAIKTWRNLLSKYGNPPDLLPLVLNTWERLFSFSEMGEFEAEKQPLFYQQDFKMEAHKIATFLPLECTVKRWRNDYEKSLLTNTGFCNKEKNNISHKKDGEKKPIKRYCLSCGKDISEQNKRTIFCSENLYGKAAKRCRNQNSNKRRDRKRIIQKALTKNNYLAFTYSGEGANTYTDILHPAELSITKDWLDRIQQIILLPGK